MAPDEIGRGPRLVEVAASDEDGCAPWLGEAATPVEDT
jgi:hypothetical protein